MDPNFTEKIDQIQAKLEQMRELLYKLNEFNSITVRNLFKSFLIGLFSALGATVGLAIVLAILGLVVRWLGGVPGIGDLFLKLGTYLHST